MSYRQFVLRTLGWCVVGFAAGVFVSWVVAST